MTLQVENVGHVGLVFAVALRRQTVIAVVAVIGLVLQNLANGGVDASLAMGAAALVALCLAPAVFAWTQRAYRAALTVIGILLTLGAVGATAAGSPGLLPAALFLWLMLLPIRRPGGS